MNRNNLIFLGLGVLVAYLIFKPKGAKASTTPQPPIDCEKEWEKYWEKNFAHVKMTKEGVEGEKRNFMAKCRGTNVTPTPIVKFQEGKQYTLTLERDYPPFKKGDKLTGVFIRVNTYNTRTQPSAGMVAPVLKEEIFRVEMPMQGDARPREYNIPMRNFVEYLR